MTTFDLDQLQVLARACPVDHRVIDSLESMHRRTAIGATVVTTDLCVYFLKHKDEIVRLLKTNNR